MHGWLTFWFAYFPYICLSVMATGICYRYVHSPGSWNSHSTELMETKLLRLGSPLFHVGALLAVGGHAAGLLVPESVWEFLLGSAGAHDEIALFAGKFVSAFMLLGLGILVGRRLSNARVQAASGRMDHVVAAVLAVSILTGCWQVYVAHAPLFPHVGPWLRGLLVFRPDPLLMAETPMFMRLHVIAAFTLFALIPFSRLVHMLSVPLTYAVRPLIVYRKQHAASRQGLSPHAPFVR